MPGLIDWKQLKEQRQDKKWESFSWLTLRALISSANDVLAKGLGPRLVNDMRRAWMNHRPADQLVVDETRARKFIVLGDPGEQDSSQYAVVPVLLQEAAETKPDFMVVLSDVIYPAGDANDYVDGFYIPYRDLTLPVYALPGNHDWYDSLNGFMWNFCGTDAPPTQLYDPDAKYSWKERLARALWSSPSKPDVDRLKPLRDARAQALGEPQWSPRQPAPYFAIDLANVLVVCVDPGISGPIDAGQARWLVNVSATSPKPKVLLTGKPLIDKMEYHPCEFAGGPVTHDDGTRFASVDDVVTHAEFGYIAAIGGDTHNYQRYDVTLKPDGRPFHYLVSGGGGAYTSATHIIPPPDAFDATNNLAVEHFASYPTRTDSLRYFSRLMVPRLWQLVLWVTLATLGVAAAAGVVAVFDDGGDTIDYVVVGALALLGLRGLLVISRTGDAARRAVRPTPLQRVAGYMTALLGGLTLGIAGWWVDPPGFSTNIAWIAGLVAGGFLIAFILRETGWWRARAIAKSVIAAEVIAATAVLVFLLIHAHANGWLAAVTAVLTVLALPATPLTIYSARRRFPRTYKFLLAGTLTVVVVAGAILLADTSVPRAAVAAVTLTAAAALGGAIAHLNFFNAFSLLWRWNMHSGELDPAEADATIRWRASDDKAHRPANGRTRRIANMVYPGKKTPSGPLQKLVSEIFDSDFAPFHKNFLIVEEDGKNLTITCIHATGEEVDPSDITKEPPVVIPLPETD